MHPRSVLVLARHDSFFKAGLHHARVFERLGARIEVVALGEGREGLARGQLESLGLSRVPPSRSLAQVCRRDFLESFDVVLLGLDGRPTRQVLRRVAQLYAEGSTARRPVLVSYYPGVVFRFHLEGMQSRMSSDLLLLNSPQDLELYRELCRGLGVNDKNGLLTGLSYLAQTLARAKTPDTVVFFGQPTVPAALAERAYLIEQLARLAERSPAHHIVLKPRHRPGERTLHRDRFHFEDLMAFQRASPLPPNLSVSYRPVPELLARAALVVTVSSSAALEALASGIPTRILTDFGLHENLGNHLFSGSGLLTTFPELAWDMPFVLEPTWRERHMPVGNDGGATLRAAVARLLEKRSADNRFELRSARLLGRTPEYVAFCEQEFGTNAVLDFTTSNGSPAARRFRLRRWLGRMREWLSKPSGPSRD